MGIIFKLKYGGVRVDPLLEQEDVHPGKEEVDNYVLERPGERGL